MSLLPSLSMMPRPADFKGTGSIGFFDASLPTADDERAVLSEVFPPLVEPHDINELLATLGHAREQAILVVAAHGTGAPGLSHSLKIGNERLSAAQLLNCELPATVVFGACFSARLPLILGGEPLGLPTVALLRGAAGVVGAILPPHDDSASALLAETYRALAEGRPLADALRQAQLKRIVEAPANQSKTGRVWSS